MKKLAAAAAALLLAGCATPPPSGPGILVLPGSSKNFDQFRFDDQECRSFASAQIGGKTAEQAAKFWPVYDEYQNDLKTTNERLLRLLESYAADYKSKSLNDEKAKKLLNEWIAIEQDDGKRRSTFAPKVLQALPPKKAARYLQIENEYRILLRYELAGVVPLAQ